MKEKESLINPIRIDSYLKNGIKRSTKCNITKKKKEKKTKKKQHRIRCNQNSQKYNTIYLVRSDLYLLSFQKKTNCKTVSIHLEKPKSETYLFSVDHQVSK